MLQSLGSLLTILLICLGETPPRFQIVIFHSIRPPTPTSTTSLIFWVRKLVLGDAMKAQTFIRQRMMLKTCFLQLGTNHRVTTMTSNAVTSTVTSTGTSTVTSTGTSTVTSTGTSMGTSTVTSTGTSMGTSTGTSTVTSMGTSTVTSTGTSTVTSTGTSMGTSTA